MDTTRLEAIGRELLETIGENPDREGLLDTPRRWAGFWKEFMEFDAGNQETAFTCVELDQLVAVSGIKVFSLCEHHMLPFWCEIAIGYITQKRILGLSKFARIANACSHKLQVQERLTQEIADRVQELTASDSVAVVCKGEHSCMQMRGVRSFGTMHTSVMRGSFLLPNCNARDEFLRMVMNA